MKLKRYASSPAYIDSIKVSVYLAIGLGVALWFAVILRNVINPWWLGGSIAMIFVYQLFIFWLMRQFNDSTRIFVVFIFGLISLGLIASLVAWVTGVRLPTDLPVMAYLYGFYPVYMTTFDPGTVAIYYASFAQIVAGIVSVPLWLLGDSRPVRKVLRDSWLARIDLVIDVYLDKISFKLDNGQHGWLAVLTGAIVLAVGTVVGAAALLL
jgi:hypothetical protein